MGVEGVYNQPSELNHRLISIRDKMITTVHEIYILPKLITATHFILIELDHINKSNLLRSF